MHSQPSRQGQRAGSSKFALSLPIHFYPHTLAQSTDNGGYGGLAPRSAARHLAPPPPAALASEPEITTIVIVIIIMMRASSIINNE